MVEKMKHMCKLQKHQVATTRFTVFFSLPWTALFPLFALVISLSWGYLVATFSPQQTNVYRPTVKQHSGVLFGSAPVADSSILMQSSWKRRSHNITDAPSENVHAGGRQTKTETPAQMLKSIRAARAKPSDRSVIHSFVGNSLNTFHFESIPKLSTVHSTEVQETRLHALSTSPEVSRHIKNSGFVRHSNTSREERDKVAFDEVFGRETSQQLRPRNGGLSGRTLREPLRLAKPPRGKFLPVFTEAFDSHVHRRDMKKTATADKVSLLHSGTQIIDELLATALGTSSVLLAPQAQGGMSQYGAMPSQQPPIAPTASAFGMPSVYQPLPRGADLGGTEIAFIAVGCVIAGVLFILLVWLLISGRKRRRR